MSIRYQVSRLPSRALSRGPLHSSRCVEPAAEPHGARRALRVVLMGLAGSAVGALTFLAISSFVELTTPPPRRAPTSHHAAAPPPRVADDRARPGAPPRRVEGEDPAPVITGPKGTLAGDLALVATNIPPGAPHQATALLLDEQADRYVLLSPGDKLGEMEVVRISLQWVQLRQKSANHWVAYRKSKTRRTRAPSAKHKASARRISRGFRGPRVTHKWLVGRLNLTGELEDHLHPKKVSQGLKVGKVTTGFRRIGVRRGDVIQKAGDRQVRSLDDIREGLQSATQPGSQSSITVLRRGRTMTLDFGVR